MLSIVARIFALIAVLTLISALVPDAFTSAIDQGIQYVTANICYFNNFMNASTIFTAIQILIGFFTTIVLFVCAVWFLRFTGGTK